MKKLINKIVSRFFPLVILGTAYVQNACDDEVKKPLPSVIQFSNGVQNVTEGNETIITLSLSRAVRDHESVVVAIETNAVYAEHFVTDPEAHNGTFTLYLSKGESSVKFKVSTTDNTLYEKERTITFKLVNTSGGLKIGFTGRLELKIHDDEGPSQANFHGTADVVYENDVNGVVITIPFTNPAKGQGSITLTLDSENANYGKHFTTIPAATSNSITFNISPIQSMVDLSVVPVDNNVFNGDLSILISITSVTGVVEKGSNSNYSVTIKDDEMPSIASFLANSGTVSENDDEGVIVEIPFSRPVQGEGKLMITVGSIGSVVNYGQDFVTEPPAFGGKITLSATEYQSSSSFKVLPIDNSYSNYHKQLEFKLTGYEGAIRIGDSRNFDLTIIDNEIAEASLADTTGTISENNASGIVVRINFSKPLAHVTQLIITGSGSYGNTYSTNPEMTRYQYEECPCENYFYCQCQPTEIIYYDLRLEVPKAALATEFTIKPIDNTIKNGTQVIRFNLASTNESPTIIDVGRYSLTIVDDD